VSEVLEAFSLTASLQALRVIAWVEAALDDLVLALGDDGRVRGVPADVFQRLLRERSQRGPGLALSRRQRATWVRPLNAVREALQPAVATPLNLVRNDARAPRPHTLTAKSNVHLRPSDCVKLMEALDAATPAILKADRTERFVHVTLRLIFCAGVTFEGVLKGACGLQVQHVQGAHLRIPLNASHAGCV
jgi:hypothetical protein